MPVKKEEEKAKLVNIHEYLHTLILRSTNLRYESVRNLSTSISPSKSIYLYIMKKSRHISELAFDIYCQTKCVRHRRHNYSLHI